jgi:iron complex outermembrane receptor protein
MTGFEGSPSLNVHRRFDFINPKVGITYTKNSLQAFFSYALGNKEPNRDDFQASLVSQPKNETLHDFELGIEKKTADWHVGATLYYMYYINQLVLTGQINDVGAYTRTNTPKSYRAGIELQAGAVLNSWMNVSANLTVSKNKVRSFTEYIDNYDTGGQNAVVHNNTDISFSPAVISGGTVSFIPAKHVELSFASKYVGKEYMDNSQSEQRKLNGFFTEDFRAGWTIKGKGIKEWRITGQVNNLFNKKYEPNGYTYSYISSNALLTENGYYPMAGTNFMLGVNLSF